MTIDQAREIAETIDAIDRYEEAAQLLREEMTGIEHPSILRVELKRYDGVVPNPCTEVDFQGNGDSWDGRIQQAMIKAALAEMETLKQELETTIHKINVV